VATGLVTGTSAFDAVALALSGAVTGVLSTYASVGALVATEVSRIWAPDVWAAWLSVEFVSAEDVSEADG
jgi:hypothetical protein